ncbi:MAG: TonB-dependent receptor [Bacteroidales bacterium]|jgi:hypothetical protein|nr:TonB-dependent receptor [Bacteroidales bacterium]
MKKVKKLSLFLFFLATISSSWAQVGTVKGFVYDDNNGEPVPFCFVQLQGTAYHDMTERTGAFLIGDVPPGKYVLSIAINGYLPVIDTIDVTKSAVVKRYFLKPSAQQLEEISVVGEAQQRIQDPRVSVVTITPKDINKMPSIGGSPDIAQYLQIVPGIVSTGDQGGQLYVRGGTPSQNMVYLDGMVVFSPFHSMGLFSVFDADMINSAEIYTSSFNAEYGGRISSIMDISTRDGNRKQLSGKIDLNTFGAKLLLEGPLVKLKENRSTTLTFLLSAKGSFLEQSAKVFYPYVEQGLPYNYMDCYGKLSLGFKGGSKFNFFGFYFDDKVNYSNLVSYNWSNWGVGTHFLIVPGQVSVTIDGTIAYSSYQTGLADEIFKPRKSTLGSFSANMNFNYFFKKSTLHIGFDLIGYNTQYEYYNTRGDFYNPEDHSTDIGFFVKYKYNYKDKFLFEPGFRLHYYASLSAASPEPRLAIKYNITPKVRLKLAGGLYSQNFVSISSDQDVVNLFYGFLSSPESMPNSFMNKEMKNNLQKAQHGTLGLELDVIKHTSINVEGFIKNFSQLINTNRYKLYDDLSIFSDKPEILRRDYIWEKGVAYGGDITVKFDYKGIYLWAAYTLSWTKRTDELQSYFPHFDRRHNLNVVLSYACGKRKSWQFDARWNYGSGFPFTQIQSFYPQYDFGSIGEDYITNNETLGILLDGLNKGKLPAYHRLDLSVKKKFYIGERHAIDVSVSATNVYNYKNIFYVNRVTKNIVYQLPCLYSVSFAWSF